MRPRGRLRARLPEKRAPASPTATFCAASGAHASPHRAAGFETAAELAKRGAAVVLACRRVDAAEEAAAKIRCARPRRLLAACRDTHPRSRLTHAWRPLLRPPGRSASAPGADVKVLPLDLSSQASVRAFATSFTALQQPLHILVR